MIGTGAIGESAVGALSEGGSSGPQTAPGALLQVVASILAGAASGPSTAPSAMTHWYSSLIPGVASGGGPAVAPGALLSCSWHVLSTTSQPTLVWRPRFIDYRRPLRVLGCAVPGAEDCMDACDFQFRSPAFTIDASEVDDVVFDFSSGAGAGVQIQEATVLAEVVRGKIDADAQQLASGQHAIGRMDGELFVPDVEGLVVLQRIDARGRVVGNAYSLRCEASLSGGRRLVAAGRVAVRRL